MINLVEPKKEPLTRFWERDYPARRSPCRIEICVTVVKVDEREGQWRSIPIWQVLATGQPWSEKDFCGNVLKLSIQAGSLVLVYNGKEVARCVYDNGQNQGFYWKTIDDKAFHHTWWLSNDPDKAGPGDEGTPGKWDWVIWEYDCIAAPAAPTATWLESSTIPMGNPGDPGVESSDPDWP